MVTPRVTFRVTPGDRPGDARSISPVTPRRREATVASDPGESVMSVRDAPVYGVRTSRPSRGAARAVYPDAAAAARGRNMAIKRQHQKPAAAMRVATCITPAPSVSVMSVTTTDPGTYGVSANSTADAVISASYHHRWRTAPPAPPTPVVDVATRKSGRLPFPLSPPPTRGTYYLAVVRSR